MKSHKGIAILAATVLTIISGAIIWAGNRIKDSQTNRQINLQQIQKDYEKECFDDAGHPRSVDLCKPLNDFNQQILKSKKVI
jgi:hypothetical protein